MQPSNYIPGLCTHLLYAFANVSDNFTLKPYQPADIQAYKQYNALKAKDKPLKTILSIGGGDFPVNIGFDRSA